MATLTRVTTEYHRGEDRIRFVGELQGGEVAVIWVTQRLLNRLVQELVAWLEGTEQDLPRAEVLHSFKQQTARQQVTAQAPVPAAAAASDWLCQAVDVQKRPNSLGLVFRDVSGDHRASLELQPQALRQWLNMLQATCVRAEWPMTAWPEWLREQPVDSRPQHLPLH